MMRNQDVKRYQDDILDEQRGQFELSLDFMSCFGKPLILLHRFKNITGLT